MQLHDLPRIASGYAGIALSLVKWLSIGGRAGKIVARHFIDKPMPFNLPAELDRLASELMEYAREGLTRDNELLPIGAAITPIDEIQWCAVEDAAHSDVTVVEEVTNLVHGMSVDARAGRFVATGVLCSARVQPPNAVGKVDALELRLDHRRGDSVRIYVPYELGATGISFHGLFASEGDCAMFPDKLVQIETDRAKP